MKWTLHDRMLPVFSKLLAALTVYLDLDSVELKKNKNSMKWTLCLSENNVT